MSWDRGITCKALAAQLEAALTAGGVNVFERPLFNLNPPAVVVGRASEVRYGMAAFGIDEVTLPVTVVGATEADDDVQALLAAVRAAVLADTTLGGAVQLCLPTAERNWRPLKVAGADLLAADLVLEVQQ